MLKPKENVAKFGNTHKILQNLPSALKLITNHDTLKVQKLYKSTLSVRVFLIRVLTYAFNASKVHIQLLCLHLILELR